MIDIKPDFYSKFSCTADKCTDSCCIGWEIDVDEDTARKYNNIGGDFGEFLRNSIDFDGIPHFNLCENDRCPLLNKNGLCDLIINCGEEYLCDICREHPRFYEWYGNYRDCGIGLCCEEACRLLFSSDKSLGFTEEINNFSDDNDINSEFAEEVFILRNKLFEIIADRSIESLTKRIKLCSDFILSVQNVGDIGANCNTNTIVKEVLEIVEEAEPFDETWTEFINTFSFEGLKKIKEKTLIDYERLFTYFIFRHFIKAVYDNDFVTHFKTCMLIFIIQLLFDRSNNELDKIETVKYISKQFEYSLENTQLLEFECSQNARLSFKNLLRLIENLL